MNNPERINEVFKDIESFKTIIDTEILKLNQSLSEFNVRANRANFLKPFIELEEILTFFKLDSSENSNIIKASENGVTVLVQIFSSNVLNYYLKHSNGSVELFKTFLEVTPKISSTLGKSFQKELKMYKSTNRLDIHFDYDGDYTSTESHVQSMPQIDSVSYDSELAEFNAFKANESPVSSRFANLKIDPNIDYTEKGRQLITKSMNAEVVSNEG